MKACTIEYYLYYSNAKITENIILISNNKNGLEQLLLYGTITNVFITLTADNTPNFFEEYSFFNVQN